MPVTDRQGEKSMKKIISLLSLFFMLTLLVPSNQAEAARGSGGIGGYSGREGSGGSGGYRGSDRHPGSGRIRGSDRDFGPKGFKGSDRHSGFRFNRGPDRHRGHGRHRVFGGFLPGLVIGGILGWGFSPRYDYPPTYQDPYPPEGDRPSGPAGQGLENRMRIYPRQGQTEEQQALDFDECHSWAVDQTGFDPEIPPEGPSDTLRSEKSADYMRAISACLDARGYDLR
jgi:hypothetical protein